MPTTVRALVEVPQKESDVEKPARWTNLPAWIEQCGGFALTDVELLLNLSEEKMAGSRIVADIERRLEAAGVGHLPPRLPTSRSGRVLLYKKDSGAGLILEFARLLAREETPASMTVDGQVMLLADFLGANLQKREPAAS